MYAIVMAHKLNELAQAGKQAEPCKHFWGQRFAVNAIGNFDKILAKKLPIFVLNQCYNFLENMTDREKKQGVGLHTSTPQIWCLTTIHLFVSVTLVVMKAI